MSETENAKPKGSKKMIAIIIAAIVLVGGGAAAFFLTGFSDKEKYFLAEKKSFDFVVDQFKDRYEPELGWYEHMEENPTSHTMEFSAEYNDPMGPGMMSDDPFDPVQMINNSSLTVISEEDMQNEQLATSILLNIAGIEIDEFNVYITAEQLMVGLPFLDEILKINDEDIGSLLHELDPYTFTGEESLDLESIFEGYPQEDIDYFMEEYGQMIYEQLPDEAFESTNESVEVNGETVNAEKITMHLNEDLLKDLLFTIFDKLENDERVKELIEEEMTAQFMQAEIETAIGDFEQAMKDAKNGLDDFHFPDGLTSTIWTENDLIVKRSFEVEMGPTDDMVTLSIDGTQSLGSDQQTFDYDFTGSDQYSEGTMNLTGESLLENEQISDSIALTVEDVTLSYEGSETLTDGTRDFERTFSVSDAYFGGSLIWNGSETYDNDQMNGEHQLSIETSDLNQDLFSLFVEVEGTTIDGVTMPAEEDTKDIGSMSANELMDYVETELYPNFEQWLFGIMASSGEFGL